MIKMEKPFLHHLAQLFIIVLIASASFGLGRFTLLESRKVPVSIDYFTSTTTKTESAPQTTELPSQQASVALAPIPGVKGIVQPQEKPQVEQIPASTTNSVYSVRIVASKKGKRYYYENCAGAKNLSAANKVYFKSPAEAEEAGLIIATGCTSPH